jgi:hypothetical protein
MLPCLDGIVLSGIRPAPANWATGHRHFPSMVLFGVRFLTTHPAFHPGGVVSLRAAKRCAPAL